MKKVTVLLFCFLQICLFAQHTVSGTFSPAADFTWIIAYKLKPGTQVYVADAKIQAGNFTLTLPKETEKGTYRMVYAVPQEEFYFDIIYDGNEDIKLAFDAESGVTFLSSQENQIFSDYFREIQKLEQDLIAFYATNDTVTASYKKTSLQMRNVQRQFEDASKNMVAHDFIVSNAPYIPEGFEPITEYVQHRKEHYFDHLDLQNKNLQASGFLTDKLMNYVFTALPLEPMSHEDTQGAMNKNVDVIADKINDLETKYQMHVFYSVWTQAAASRFNQTSDYIYNIYLKKLAEASDNQKMMDDITLHNRLRIGAKAPNLTWPGGSLYQLAPSKRYILIFWSSVCSHCLAELPKLESAVEGHDYGKFLAIGLEKDENHWQAEQKKLPAFQHVIALGKWESDAAQQYAIQQTPSYVVLDSNKKITAKPEDYHELLQILRKED